MKTFDCVLRSDYSPDACLARLAEQIDIDQLTLFSLSGYRGSKPILAALLAMNSVFTNDAIGITALGPSSTDE